jgi:hypothetical protein
MSLPPGIAGKRPESSSMVSWFSRLLQKAPNVETAQGIRLSTTRFRHLLRQYGQMIRLGEDAAEKQVGEYILDKQYIVALSDKAFETAEGILYDLNVLTDQGFAELYACVEALHERTKTLIATGTAPRPSVMEGTEESEYRLLREVRGALFRYDISDAAQDKESAILTLPGIVQSAQEAAGDSLAKLARLLASPWSTTIVPGDSRPRITTTAVDLMGCLSASNNPPQIRDADSVNSFPLGEFLSSFSRPEFRKDSPRDVASSESALLAAIALEDSINVTVFHKQGFILVDAYVSCVPDLNYIYCRFSSDLESVDDSFVSPSLAADIFARLGFSVARTRRGATGWSASQPLRETTSKLRAIGRMAAYLFPFASAGIQSGPTEKEMSQFFEIHD